MGGGRRVPISRARKRVVGIFISCLGLIVVVSHLISELLQAGSLTSLLQHWAQPSMIVHLSIEFLTIPAFMVIGYFYQKQKNLAENLEKIVEERTSRLRESQTRLENIFAASPDAITVTDLNGNIIECNQAALDMLGFSSKEELIGKSGFALVTKKDRERAKENLKKILEQGSMRNIEYIALTKDGCESLTELSANVIKDSSGNPTGLVAITKDITERKQMEEKIKKTAEEWKKTFDSISDFVNILNDDFRIVRANKATCDLLKKEPEELIGKRCFEVLHGTDKHWPNCPHKKTLETKRATTEEINDPNLGIPLLVTTSPIFDENGELVGSVHIAKDITESKKAEEKLRFLKEFNERVVDSIGDALLVIDPNDYTIISANEATSKQLNLRKEDLIGKTCYEITHHRSTPCEPPHDICPIQEMLKTGKPITVEHTHFDRDNNEIYVEVSASPVRNQEGKIVQVVHLARNVTDRKKAEKALKESEQKLRDVIDNSSDVIVWVDTTGKITLVNRKGFELTGFSEKDLIGKNFMDVEALTQESKEKILENFMKRLEGINTPPYEVEIVAKNGEVIPVELSASLIYEGGKIVGTQSIFRDLRERKKAEEALRESEEKFRNLAEQSPNMIFINKKGRMVYANKKCEEIMGYKKEEFYSPDFDFLTLISPESVHLVKASFNKHMKGEEVAPFEYTLVTKEGKRIDAIIATRLIRYGGESAILGIVTDITERKKAEEKLRESEERFRNLFESAGDGILTLDLRGRVTSANKKIEEISGISREEIIGKYPTQFIRMGIISLKDVSLILKALTARIKGQPSKVYEFRVKNKKGQEKFIECRGSLIKRGGKPIGILEIIRDVTERKKMEEKLRHYSEHLEELVQKRTEELLESEKRYSVLVEEAGDGVFIGQDEKIVFANKKGAEIFGYSRDELIGLSFEKLVDEKYLQLVKERNKRRLRGEKVPSTYEIALIAKTGERIPVEATATRIHYQGRPAVLVIIRDVRERKLMEEQRLRLEKLATIGELATMVGHDLRNPLQSIENATYYLNNELSRLTSSIPIPQKAMEMLQVLNDSVNYADKIIRDLKDFSATKKPILKKTNINTIVKEILSKVETPQNVKLTTELGCLPEIKADKGMIKRVFLNLAINGIQAMENGGTLKVSTKKTKKFVEVSFKDTGVGISKENMKKIFTPFFTTKAKGMGMGLPICKRLVDSHGGSIKVESEEGKGTTFTVKLPIQQENGGEKQ